jgi:hypothetical protein
MNKDKEEEEDERMYLEGEANANVDDLKKARLVFPHHLLGFGIIVTDQRGRYLRGKDLFLSLSLTSYIKQECNITSLGPREAEEEELSQIRH